MFCGMHMCVVFTVWAYLQYRYQILWIADFVGFIFTDACVTNSTVTVLMNATLSGKGVLLSSLTLTFREMSLVKQPHCSALGIHCTFPSLKS